MDDYELVCGAPGEADEAIALLQHSLLDFELSLNPRKTRQMRLPQPLEHEWASTLRRIEFHKLRSGQQRDIVYYFDRLSEFVARHPDEHVMKYGVGTLTKRRISRKSDFRLLSRLLMHAALTEPSVLPRVTQWLLAYAADGYTVDKGEVGLLLDTIIGQHARLGHGSEVAWALWSALVFRIALSTTSGTAVGKMSDPVVAVLALDAAQQTLLPNVSAACWATAFNTKQLYAEQWLLAYEAAAQGWVPSSHVAADSAFAHLLSAGVKFYSSVTSPPPPKKTVCYGGGSSY